MSKNLVGDTSVELAAVIEDIMRKYRAGAITLDHLKRVAKMEATPFAPLAKDGKRDIEKYAAKLSRKLSGIFKKRVFVDPLPPEFTDENLAHWATFNMRPVFLPGEEIGKDRPLKNWIKPEQWFYDHVANGSIKPIHSDLKPTMLRRGWYLADFTVSADYIDGSQVFVNDPLASVISDLRDKKLVGKNSNTPIGSRFAIRLDEWQDIVLAHVASKLNVMRSQMRLERAVEFNAIGNLYDPNRGKFNAWEWFEDHFGDSYFIFGGGGVLGGLAHVSRGRLIPQCSHIAARPLVSFVR